MYKAFWESFFDPFYLNSGTDNPQVPCPFHLYNQGKDDENPSMAVNLHDGTYICFSCSGDENALFKPQGDSVDFLENYFYIPKSNAILLKEAYLATGTVLLPLQEEDVRSWHSSLWQADDILRKLREKRGLSDITLRRLLIGWDGQRVTIPIRNYRGEIVNVRRYSFVSNDKVINIKPLEFQEENITKSIHLGNKRIWPMEILVLTDSPFVMFAGEMDSILAYQMGIPAVTMTSGEGALWKPEWNRYVKGRQIWICYDIDKKGRTSAQRLAMALHEAGAKVHIIDLPITAPKNGDFTDYVIKAGHTVEDFRQLMAEAARWEPPVSTTDRPVHSDSPIQTVSLVASTYDPKWQGKRVALEVNIVGKDTSPYTIVKEADLTCSSMSDDNPACAVCPLSSQGKIHLNLTPEKDLLHLIRIGDGKKREEIGYLANVPKCPKWDYDVTASYNVEEILVTPRVEPGLVNGLYTDHTLQPVFHFYDDGSKAVNANQAYRLEGVRTTDPWKQKAIHVADQAIPVKDSISKFVLTTSLRDTLRTRFGANNRLSGIQGQVDSVAGELTRCVTKIYGREDLVTALLLSYCGVQEFDFNGQRMDGLFDLLVLGDTRTGKSETAFRLLQFINLGELITGEAVSFAGLVGGSQQGASGNWVITWGRIPLNNGGLVFIDEVSGMRTDHIALLSGLRSERVARIVKIVQSKAPARTRLVWMSNPREAKKLSEYSYGVQAIPELIGQPEDVARFDLVVTCASGEVPPETINQRYDATVAESMPFTSRDLQSLILWSWSRRREQVQWTLEAEREVLKYALEMGKTYSSAIPLVESANHRIKIARLAAACAALTYSTDETGEILIVTPAHVQFVAQFMDQAYRKESLNYYGFSQREGDDERISHEKRDEMKAWLLHTRQRGLLELLLRWDTFRAQDLEDQLALDKTEARVMIKKLSDARMISRDQANYKKTPTLIALLKTIRKEMVRV